MKKFWFGMVGNWDYMATFGEICEAETMEEAIKIVSARCHNCKICRIVEMEGFKTKQVLYSVE